ncbi:glycoside hydrolase family 3 C-terminal domain-containing protein [Actinospica durhamensis]|uniref:Exo-alpha-(1->6)-L-arabinopyranosidase n=1 Tax=Actinospica durhamensis TaxID=1508375 RepID=A0A941IRB6_9ACTN|nr:glycoside hydrolase family 3 C-terminal domain-containing protein [Actinospica durhamensis]MBR7833773.1 glycoside hydrolase family 3 C-terminal domain-containing protein [Actinospica durhamensis]
MPDPTGTADLLAALSLEEKAALVSGRGAWDTAAYERLGIASITLTDGPHGLRLAADEEGTGEFSLSNAVPATCFPTASALGSSWDPDLIARVGEALGAEARASGVGVLLGPGVNIKRSPLCGRNFEYFSEDPVLTGRLGAALVGGVQSKGVGACVKHFAANNQETERLRVSAQVDERTLREIYLPAFEHIVTTEQPAAIMAAYNRVNGVYATQNRMLLTEVLREEWGFQGAVVSDWGAVADPIAAISAGLNLEMPGTHGVSARRIVEAVKSGALDEAALDRAVAGVLRLVQSVPHTRDGADKVDFARHHALARQAAAESAVLLKNENSILPFDPEAQLSIAVIGDFAHEPRYQGAGSSLVNATRVENALDAMTGIAGRSVTVTYARGFTQAQDEREPELHAAAVATAAAADVAVLFLGLPAGDESEGYDRTHIDLPQDQIRLLEDVAAVNPRVVVVLANGGVVRTSTWEQHASAILEGWLAGQAGGAAIADLLFGKANPSGRLAETVPLRLEDTPAYLNFPGTTDSVLYGERIYVGYRHYDAKTLPVSYPFGHGLSYTTFAYSDLRASVEGEGDDVRIRVSLTLANSGTRAGKEVVQLYVGDPIAGVDRPARELKAFAKVELAPGESRDLEFELGARDLSYFDASEHRWILEAGEFELSVGASSRDLRLCETVTVDAPPRARRLSLDSTVGEWLADPVGAPVLISTLSGTGSSFQNPEIQRMVAQVPLGRLVTLTGGRIDAAKLDRLIAITSPDTPSR